MGAVRPWHLMILLICCLGVAGVIAAVALLMRRR